MILLCNVYSFKNTSLRMSIKKVWRTFLLMGGFFFSFSFHFLIIFFLLDRLSIANMQLLSSERGKTDLAGQTCYAGAPRESKYFSREILL